VHKYPPEKVLYLTTGSQGEPMSALSRISRDEHPKLKIREGDTVVLSANPIPGNTISVVNMIDDLMIRGAKVIYGKEQGIHVSGHGCQEDQKLMLSLTRPKFFLPVHGEHRMLVKHSQTAQSLGVPAENMVIIDNGDVVELTDEAIRVVDKVPSGIELVDRAGVVKAHVLQERQQLAEDGIITVAATLSSAGKLVTRPEVHLRGVVTTIERPLWQGWVQDVIESVLRDRWKQFATSVGGGGGVDIDWAGLQAQIEQQLLKLLRRELQSNASLVLLLQTVEEELATSGSPNGNGNGGARRQRSTARMAS
jgi:ribonuclease J